MDIGFSSSVEAELWALRDGLSLCLSLNILAMEVEIDVKVVSDWIIDSNSSNLNISSLIVTARLYSVAYLRSRSIIAFMKPTSVLMH